MSATGGRFETTRWSVVLAAGSAPEAERRAALESLCAASWPPLYAFARRDGAPPEAAADLVQGFFADLLGRDGIGAADPERGRFRTYLLAAFRHYRSRVREKERAAKRGGGAVPIRLDVEIGERGYLAEPADDRTPERIYARRWALGLLDRVLGRLAGEYDGARAALFAELRPRLTAGGDAPPLAAVAARLGMGVGAVKVALHRMRRRYRDLLRAAIAETVSSPEEVDDELGQLMEALAG